MYSCRIQKTYRKREEPKGKGDGKGAEGPTKKGKIPAAKGPAVKVGANDPCPCGSGKKYKKCHGKG